MTDVQQAPAPNRLDPLTFLFRGELVHLHGVMPTLTLLQWLRYHARRSGTKEGCAEGDCGACTVLIGELQGDTVKYRSVDSCLVLMPMLHGREVVTVEDLDGEEGFSGLNPVQAAMVEHGGSQCGFCTPGFVMSLLDVSLNSSGCTRAQVQEGISGNLCRCTGYRPIVDAGVSLAGQVQESLRHQWETRALRHATILRQISRASTTLAGEGCQWWRPTSLDEATTLLAQNPGAELLSGGTDLGLEVTKRRRRLSSLIYLGDVPDLQHVDVEGPIWRFGAGLTYAQWMPIVKDRLPALYNMFSLIGSPQIRHLGTVGGNLGTASPIGDSAPVLLAYGASLELVSVRGKRVVPLADYFRGYRSTQRQPDELIAAVHIPRPADSAVCHTYKISRRTDMDISAVAAVYYLERDDAGRVTEFRTGLGGVAATPTRAKGVELWVRGRTWDAATVEEAATQLGREVLPITDHRGSAEFRQVVLANTLRQFGIDVGGL